MLEAHYNGAISVDLLKAQQRELDQELAGVKSRLVRHLAGITEADTIIPQALDLCENLSLS